MNVQEKDPPKIVILAGLLVVAALIGGAFFYRNVTPICQVQAAPSTSGQQVYTQELLAKVEEQAKALDEASTQREKDEAAIEKFAKGYVNIWNLPDYRKDRGIPSFELNRRIITPSGIGFPSGKYSLLFASEKGKPTSIILIREMSPSQEIPEDFIPSAAYFIGIFAVGSPESEMIAVAKSLLLGKDIPQYREMSHAIIGTSRFTVGYDDDDDNAMFILCALK